MRLSFSPKILFIASGILAILFAALAADVMNHGMLEQFDHALAKKIYTAVGEPNAWVAMFATGLGSGRVTGPVGTLCAIGLLVLGRWRYAIFWVGTLLGVAALVSLLKALCHRPRPDEFTYFLTSVFDKSGGFPSGHAMGALVVWGSLAYVLVRMYPNRPMMARVLIAAVAIIVLLVSGGLLCIGVHYLTDILGALTAGGAWLALCIGLMEWFHRRVPPVAQISSV